MSASQNRMKQRLALTVLVAAAVLGACGSEPPAATPAFSPSSPATTNALAGALTTSPSISTTTPMTGPATTPPPTVSPTLTLLPAATPTLPATVTIISTIATAAGTPATQTVPVAATCAVSADEGPGPYYKPNAPVRSSVGQGHVLTGVVRSGRDCRPLPDAIVELWMANQAGVYVDEHRASVPVDPAGAFRFESHPPVPYGGGSAHIHVRASAPGHRPVFAYYIPASGAKEGKLDLVLKES